ncbi:MAG: hypoxanthine phosphoribosyltransferase [Candidatus Methylacidiphilales bacterium]
MSLPGRTLISSRRIRSRVRDLAGDIARHYEGREFTVVGLMHGSLFFMVDLMRHLPPATLLECCRVASYQGTHSAGKLDGLDVIQSDYSGRHLLIVDDILDTGLTLSRVTRRLYERKAASVESCVLLSKKRPRTEPAHARWVGFEIDDHYVIGYGLDLNQQYRNLPMIRVLDT